MKTIIIEGMSCGKCVANVEKALGDVTGITKMDVEVGKAIVEGTATDADLKEAIEDFGFDVIEIK
ncbi:MAG: heavy-metal-associated domain-containing protein [Sarcina sp.]